MSDNKNENTKASLRNKLSLKRSNSDSTQSTLNSIISCPKNDVNKPVSHNSSMSQDENAFSKPDVEDSLADFKSPKDEKVSKPILNKFKFEKVKRKLVKSKSKSTKPVVDTNQPLIESSFFKPQILNQPEAKEASPCPLCLKPFKDDVTCYNHMKSCAAKNKVSLQQLLDAKKLQERQAEERKAMGLLAAPVIPEKKKTFRPKNYTTGDDPQLQLVLAMSESLYEAEQQQELEQAAVLAGIPSECLKDINSEDRKTLRDFGFSTNKPAVEVTVRQKKRKLLGPTVLQSRSKEDKDRVLTERIACIITGDDALTQTQSNKSIESLDRPLCQLRSRKLRSIEQLENKLWDLSRLTKKCINFYVEELRLHFSKSNEQINQRRESESFAQAPSDENDINITLNTSIVYEPVDIEFLVNQNKESSLLEMNNTNEMKSELDYIKDSNSRWVQALNSMTKSDLVILVQNNKKVYAHQLVLFVQCPQILHSKEPNDSLREGKIKEKISWLLYDQLSVLAFLEFIYCGCIIKNINFLEKEDFVKEVKKLAEKYQVESLVKYIELKQNERKLNKSKKSNVNRRKEDKHSPRSVHTSKSSTHSRTQKTPKKAKTDKSYDQNSLYADQLFDHSPVQRSNIPPTKKVISYETYRKSQGLPVTTNTQPSTSFQNVEISTEAEIHVPKSLEKLDKEPQILNNDKILLKDSEVSNNDTEIPSRSIEMPPANTKKTSTPVQQPKSILKNRFTSSPVLFESEDESIHGLSSYQDIQAETSIFSHQDIQAETSIFSTEGNPTETNILSQKSNQAETSILLQHNNPADASILSQKNNEAETSHNNTYLNILVDLANENDEIDDVSQNEKNQLTRANSDDYKSESNSQNTIVNVPQSPKNLESLSLSSPENIHNRLTPDREQMLSQKNTNTNARNDVSLDQSDISTNPEPSTSSKTNEAPQVMEIIEIDSDNDESIYNAVDESIYNAVDESIYNAVTPPRPNNDDLELMNNPELNSFINKVRRKNARDILETDSESDISMPQGRRNPFLTRNRDDSYRYLNNDDNKALNRKVISILEREISRDEKLQNERNAEASTSSQTLNQSTEKNQSKNVSVNDDFEENDDLQIIENIPDKKSADDSVLNNTENSNKNDSLNLSSDQVNSDVTVNESEMSMYSRYKKHNVHENSIHKYREKLDFERMKSSLNQKNNDASDIKADNRLGCSSKETFQLINPFAKKEKHDVTLVYDSDEETITAKSMTQKSPIKSTQSQLENSNKNEVIDISCDSDEENNTIYNIQNISDSSDNKKTTEKEKSLNSETNTEKNDNCDIINLSPIDLSLDDDPNKSSNSNKDNDKNASDNEWFNDINHFDDWMDDWSSKSLTKTPDQKNQSSAMTSDKRNFPTKGISTKNQHSQLDSPLSPQASTSRDTRAFKNKSSEYDSPQSPPAETSKNVVTTEMQYSELDTPQSPPPEDKFPNFNSQLLSPKFSELESPQSPPPQDSGEQLQNVRSPLSPSPILSQNRKKTKAIRKLQTKSASSSNFETPQKKRSTKTSHEYEDALKNLSSFDTPQLKKELKKFGIKPQNRENSKLLLKHVYTGIAQQRSTSPKTKKRILSDDLSEEDEPPLKKLSVTEKSKKDSSKEKNRPKNNSDSENRAVEEIYSDESDGVESSSDIVNIRKAFYELLKTDRELHTKVLTYVPLPFKQLYLSLKEKGFKFKEKTLMDFLDHESITFQTQTGKNNDRRKKKK